MKIKRYEFLEHTADIKFRIYGKTLNSIFENTALAISEVISGENEIKNKIEKTITIKGDDNENLMYAIVTSDRNLIHMSINYLETPSCIIDH